MIEQAVIEYLANAFWQVPLLAAGAWLLLRMVRPSPAAQHRVWLAVLGLALMLPLHGISYGSGTGTGINQGMVRVDSVSAQPVGAGMQAFDAVGEPGGLVLGRKAGAGTSLSTSFSWITFPVTLPARVRRVHLSAVVAQWIVGLYLAVALSGLFRIAWAWRTARRLVKDSQKITLPDRAGAAVLDCARRFGVKPPEVRESSEIRGPVVVGAVAPVLLWPENFAAHPEDEVMAALCHEMAHIKRGDYLMNLLCETAALPLRWHPAAYGVGRRIRSTREMVCDAVAAEAMQSETTYAKCLLRLAQSMAGDGLMEQAAGSAAAGLFSSNVLEERVMRLIQGKAAMSARAKAARGVAGAAAMTAAIALAAMFHVVPAMAQSQTEAQSTTTGSGVQGGVVTGPVDAPPMPAPGPAPAAVSAPLVLPALPPAHVAAVQSVPPTPAAPAAPVAPPAPEKDLHHHEAIVSKDGKTYAWVNGQERELTPAERARVEAQLAEAQKKIAAEMEKLNSPEFRQQIEKAQRDAEEAARKVNSAEFQKQMADAQKQIAEAEAKVNSPEFKEQIEKAQRDANAAAQRINSTEFQKQMAEAQRQIAEAAAKLNSPEFRKQIEDAQRQAIEAEQKLNNGEYQKRLTDAQKQLAEELEKLKAEQDRQNKNEPK